MNKDNCMLLNCCDYKSTLLSLKNILGLSDIEVLQLASENLHSMEVNENLNSIVENKTILVHFFHSTKSLDPESFNEGLFPLHMIKTKLIQELQELAKTDVKYNESEWSKIFVDKLSGFKFELTSFIRLDFDDGPNAFLIREFGLNKYDGHEYYFDNSEFITDLLSYIKGKLGLNLIAIYNERSKRCIIEFVVRISKKELLMSYIKQALEYINAQRMNTNISRCNAAYWNKGIPISKYDIVSIEIFN